MIESPVIGVTHQFSGDFMRPKTQVSDQGDLYRSRLDQILKRTHPLYHLADSIDWSFFETEFGPLYSDGMGRPAAPIHLLVGLHYLKHAYNESDESVCRTVPRKPYWQYFRDCEYFQHQMPIDPTTLVRWRKRIGPDGLEKLLQRTIETARSNSRNTLSGSTSTPLSRKMLFYGYSTGVFSSRKLERSTYDSVAFRYIAANSHPDHDTIACPTAKDQVNLNDSES